MVREKTVVKIQIVQILELDGTDSMEKIIAQDCVEYHTGKDILRLLAKVWRKAKEIPFKFLEN